LRSGSVGVRVRVRVRVRIRFKVMVRVICFIMGAYWPRITD